MKSYNNNNNTEINFLYKKQNLNSINMNYINII